jgi:hypothetical protein
MYFVIGAFVLSYIPFIAAIATPIFAEKWTEEIRCLFVISGTLLMLNGVLNPIIYCWRITEIRNATRQVLQKIWKHTTVFGITNDEP